jgi:hypothetical protein
VPFDVGLDEGRGVQDAAVNVALSSEVDDDIESPGSAGRLPVLCQLYLLDKVVARLVLHVC